MKRAEPRLPKALRQIALRIAEEEIGGRPARCWGHKADRYNAAYYAAAKAIAAMRKRGICSDE